jgi:cell division transport system permease protein
MWRKTPMATAMTLLVLAVIWVLPVVLWLLTYTMHDWMEGLESKQTIALYLKSDLTATAVEAALVRVRAAEGVDNVTLITPAQGLQLLQDDPSLRDSVKSLPTNPLPPLLEVVPLATWDTPEKIAALFTELKQQPEVDLAQLDLHWVMQLYAVMQCMRAVTYALMALLGLAVVMIISNTLRLVVNTQYEELQVLKLIGASDAFILRPFLYAGLGYGLGGALLALGLLQLFFAWLDPAIRQLFSAYQLHYTGLSLDGWQVLKFFALALFSGWLAAGVAVRRQLALIEAI